METEIINFLDEKVFNPILTNINVSSRVKSGVRITRERMLRLDSNGMIKYFWSAVSGTERSIDFYRLLENENLPTFEDVLVEFRERFKH